MNVSPKSRLADASRHVSRTKSPPSHRFSRVPFAGLSSSNSHSLVAGLYKFRSAKILSVFSRPREGYRAPLCASGSRRSRPDIAPISLRYCRLYVEREGEGEGSGVSLSFPVVSSLVVPRC